VDCFLCEKLSEEAGRFTGCSMAAGCRLGQEAERLTGCSMAAGCGLGHLGVILDNYSVLLSTTVFSTAFHQQLFKCLGDWLILSISPNGDDDG
jgi:hypothetical protein